MAPADSTWSQPFFLLPALPLLSAERYSCCGVSGGWGNGRGPGARKPSSNSVGKRLAQEVVAGRPRVPIQHTYALARAAEALADFTDFKQGKVGIRVAD